MPSMLFGRVIESCHVKNPWGNFTPPPPQREQLSLRYTYMSVTRYQLPSILTTMMPVELMSVVSTSPAL